jgi:tRNA(Ile)-lysidine synthase
MSQLDDRLTSFLSGLPPVNGFCLAYSGGLDSTALLDVLCQSEVRDKLRAIHINHSLQEEADNWAEHCRQRCQHYDIPLQIIRVDARAATGESPEAAARQARYQAFKEKLENNECLLTAQHQNDQAETVLLQLLRGSGPAGLAAMPELTPFACGWLARPWLACSRNDIQRHAKSHQLSWIEDSSNSELNYDRNYLRAAVMPVLLQRWPGAIKTLARSAGLQAQSSAMLDQLGAEDIQYAQCTQNPAALSVERLLSLDTGRLSNVLRYWIGQHGLTTPSSGQLEQIIAAVNARPDSAPVVSWQGGSIGRYQNSLYAFPDVNPPRQKKWSWNPEQVLVIDELGLELNAADLKKSGLALDRAKQPLTIALRCGGERIQLPGRTHRHQLKKLLQERAVPPWLRECMPLLFHGDELIAVLGLEPVLIADGWLINQD